MRKEQRIYFPPVSTHSFSIIYDTFEMSVSEIYAATWEHWTWTEFWHCCSKQGQIWVIQPQYVYPETPSHLLWIINSPHCHCVTLFIRNTSFWKKKCRWKAFERPIYQLADQSNGACALRRVLAESKAPGDQRQTSSLSTKAPWNEKYILPVSSCVICSFILCFMPNIC